MKYYCPECGCHLNPTKGVVLLGQREKQRGLFVFDQRPGRYGYHIDTNLNVEPGSIWEFMCPVCHTDLTTHFSDKLAHIKLNDEGAEFVTVFSKVASEHATFVLTKQNVESYGDDFVNYIELSIQKYYW